MKNWQLQDAKARFSELVKKALAGEPQHITVRGEPTVIVISKKEYDKLTKPKISFVNLLRASPLCGLKLNIKRDRSPNREIEL